MHDRCPRFDPVSMVRYTELIYRLWQGETMVDEQVLKISMRCFWPDEFLALISGRGFAIVDKWGGYDGEPYGDGRTHLRLRTNSQSAVNNLGEFCRIKHDLREYYRQLGYTLITAR